MAKKQSITVPAQFVEDVPYRVTGIAGSLRAFSAVLESGDDEAKIDVPAALAFMAREMDRLYCDLDMDAWRNQQA